MHTELDRNIQLSDNQTEIEITTPIVVEISNLLKHYFAKWDKPHRRWRLPITRLSGRAVHLLAKEYQFTLHPKAAAVIRSHFKECAPGCKVHEGSLILQGLEQRKMHHFLRQRDRAQFLPEKDQWIINPDYELAKYLLANLPRKKLEKCRSFLESFTATTDPLERNSLNGKILHEPSTRIIPQGLSIILGSNLHHLCNACKIDYRLAIAIEARPLPHTIGVAVRDEDLPKYRASADERDESPLE